MEERADGRHAEDLALLVVAALDERALDLGLEDVVGEALPDTAEGLAEARRVALDDRRRAEIAPGERTGKFRTGTNQLLTDATGKSHISMEDYAVALIDEIENSRHIREVMTVGY